MGFRLAVAYEPQGDQVNAIAELTRGLREGEQHQVLLGVTGSGKTFTMAKVIEALNRPALVLAHNKTLAAQLYHEFKTFFPENAVEYFVSYYDYYQPEAYIPSSDVYIEKDATVNDELDKLRLAATKSLFERRDCVIVSSVSCIYGLGSPEAYYGMLLMLEKAQKISRNQIVTRLVEILYDRNDTDFRRGTFRVRGDVIEVYPTYDDDAYRIELWGDEIESLSQIDPLLGTVKQTYQRLPIYPKTHYVMSKETKEDAMQSIRNELEWWRTELVNQGKHIEAQRLFQRTMFDLEMMKEIGYCHGIENYSRHFSGRLPGEAPPTLLDYLPNDAVMFLDESHQTVPQLHGMYHGDRSRKEVLVAHGFRMPSALDNRPLTFEEFEHRVNQLVYVSATPGPYELTKSSGVVVEQIIRPTGLVGPDGGDPAGKRAGGRSAGTDSRAGGKQPANSGHDADQTHGGGSFRVLLRGRRALPLSALRGYDAGSDQDSTRSAARRIRRAGGNQFAARGIGPARSFPGGDPGRGQGRLSAFLGRADSDYRTRGAARGRARDSLCRCDDGQHAEGSGGDRPPAADADRVQRAPITSRRNRSSRRSI